jgi:hypothetical protein
VSGRIIDRGYSAGVHPSPGDDLVLLAYAYEVEGQRLVGTRFDFAGRNTVSRSAELQREFPLGARVTVYHDRRDPSRAVLRPGIGLWTVLPLVVSGAFAVVTFPVAYALLSWLVAR